MKAQNLTQARGNTRWTAWRFLGLTILAAIVAYALPSGEWKSWTSLIAMGFGGGSLISFLNYRDLPDPIEIEYWEVEKGQWCARVRKGDWWFWLAPAINQFSAIAQAAAASGRVNSIPAEKWMAVGMFIKHNAEILGFKLTELPVPPPQPLLSRGLSRA